ncbi:MAG: L,D-transpeptidase family protein [Cyanobacteriota bacterium]
METLAFVHCAIAYEDPGPEPQLRSLEELKLSISSSTLVGLAGGAIAVSTVMTAASNAHAAVQRKDACPSVQTLQQALERVGHDPGAVDGAFGGKTEYAVIRFQQRKGLAPDGVVDAATAEALGLNPDIACGSDGDGSKASNAITVTTSSLNVRSGPGVGHSAIDVLYNGQTVETTGSITDNWVQLKDGGWVSTAYVTGEENVRGGGGSESGNQVLAKVTRLVLKRGERKLYIYSGETKLTSYPVAVGRSGWETPMGTFQVIDKIEHPAWMHPFTNEVVPPGPENPLGERYIGFWTDGRNYIGFHGTPDRESVGRAASHGCVRMYNKDIRELYKWVAVGIPVVVEK